MDKKQLYESIMANVAREVKKALNEAEETSNIEENNILAAWQEIMDDAINPRPESGSCEETIVYMVPRSNNKDYEEHKQAFDKFMKILNGKFVPVNYADRCHAITTGNPKYELDIPNSLPVNAMAMAYYIEGHPEFTIYPADGDVIYRINKFLRKHNAPIYHAGAAVDKFSKLSGAADNCDMKYARIRNTKGMWDRHGNLLKK